jgi:hypothetical protein
MKCQKCNAVNEDGAKFCSTCGAELSKNSEAEQLSENIKKLTKYVFTLLHIINFVVCVIIMLVFGHCLGASGEQAGDYIRIDNRIDHLGWGFLIGGFLFILNFFVLILLKKIVNLIIKKNTKGLDA